MADTPHHLPHPRADVNSYLAEEAERMRTYFDAAPATPDNLFSYYLIAEHVYTAGGVVSPKDPAVTEAVRSGAEAISAIFGCAAPTPEVIRVFDCGLPVLAPSAAVARALLTAIEWQKGIQLAMIARRADLTGRLCGRPTEEIGRRCGLPPTDENLLFIELATELWRQPTFTLPAVFSECEEVVARGVKKPKPGGPFVQCITKPYLEVVRSLARGSTQQVTAALTEGIKSHYKYWTSSAKLRMDTTGFISLQLTALAALAWDRGVYTNVDSAYMPHEWVTGEAFR